MSCQSTFFLVFFFFNIKSKKCLSLDVTSLFSFLNPAYATFISTARGIFGGLGFRGLVAFLLFVIEQSFVICQGLSFPFYFTDFQVFFVVFFHRRGTE